MYIYIYTYIKYMFVHTYMYMDDMFWRQMAEAPFALDDDDRWSAGG